MNIKQLYEEKVRPQLSAELGIENTMAVPKVAKVVINIGLKEAVSDKSVAGKTASWMGAITGQKPKETRAKKSIANFKVRQGDVVGMAVTLRGKRMYDFMQKLFTIVLPRVRDFQGVEGGAFDGQGNYTLGLAEQIAFPEIDYAKIDKVRGLEITFVTSAGEPVSAKRLLELLGMPFKKG